MRLSYNLDRLKAFAKKVDEVIRKPVIVYVNKFDEDAAKKFHDSFSDAHETGQTVIPVVIDSYGGEAYSLLSMVDTIKSSSLPVATICTGKAMSCGAILLTCGANGMRYAGPNSTIMIHEVSSGMIGKCEELKSATDEAVRLNKQVFEMMALNCGQPSDYFENLYNVDMRRANWFLTPQEAMRHKLINHIKVPNLSVKISVDYTIE